MSDTPLPRRPSDFEARAIKPATLGDVERELLSPDRLRLWQDERLQTWTPVRGWICTLTVVPDHEGPDYYFWYAYEVGGTIFLAQRKVGYDSYHWGNSQPEYYGWFHERIKPGRSLTILVDPAAPQESAVFGVLEPYYVASHGKPHWPVDWHDFTLADLDTERRAAEAAMVAFGAPVAITLHASPALEPGACHAAEYQRRLALVRDAIREIPMGLQAAGRGEHALARLKARVAAVDVLPAQELKFELHGNTLLVQLDLASRVPVVFLNVYTCLNRVLWDR